MNGVQVTDIVQCIVPYKMWENKCNQLQTGYEQ